MKDLKPLSIYITVKTYNFSIVLKKQFVNYLFLPVYNDLLKFIKIPHAEALDAEVPF